MKILLTFLEIYFVLADRKLEDAHKSAPEILAAAYKPMITDEGRLDLSNPYARLYHKFHLLNHGQNMFYHDYYHY
ncbi:Oidioi.mRNA.OKI2018_I69.chr2.g4287.t1.cds [Oikopleura dioica]|uniref:Oidioi.mRNA.OKI2018_I69.chr2.g4287.t1.cds n=1 Tax=Oikopleura dioica TaxID=34765 RepID=A0ABN7SYG6_OIKDI|nr:Oidioi.mRNA.OKI2018_I69.chr2.g4287.t1.cds [Oikopleura dioica]